MAGPAFVNTSMMAIATCDIRCFKHIRFFVLDMAAATREAILMIGIEPLGSMGIHRRSLDIGQYDIGRSGRQIRIAAMAGFTYLVAHFRLLQFSRHFLRCSCVFMGTRLSA